MRKLLFVCVFWLKVTSVSAADIDREVPYVADAYAERLRIDQIRRSMDAVVYESLDISELPLKDAVQRIQKSLPKSDRGYSYIFRSPTDPAHVARLEQPSALKFTNSSLPTILNQLCEHYDLMWSCRGKIVIGDKIE